MYPYRRRSSPLPRLITLAAFGIIAGLGVALAFGLPRIVGVAPEGGGASSRAPIVITFNRTMNRESVESRIQIDPPAPGAFSWSGASVQFTPSGEWPAGTIRVALAAGAKTDRGLPLLVGRSWKFSIGAPRVAFIMKTNNVPNVWAVTLDGGAPTQITHEPVGVRGFAVSMDGTQIVYSAMRADGGADLRQVNRDGVDAADLLLCPNEICAAPAISPDGKRIAFERYPLLSTGEPGQPKVEVLDLASGQTMNPADDPSRVTRAPGFAPDGRLSYLDATLQAIAVYDFNARFTTFVPDTSGDTGTWSPDGQYIVFPEIVFPPEPTLDPSATDQPAPEERFYSHLQQVTVATNAVKNLSGDSIVEDASPVYSPNGQWLAFGRKSLLQDQWTPGRQLWLMRANGSDARALTAEPFYNHSAFVWSADGLMIIYMRFDITDPASVAEIWAVNTDGSSAHKLVTGGYLPEWLP